MHDGAKVDDRDFSGLTAIELAQKLDRPRAAKALLEAGADSNQRVGKRGDTLLHRCARQGDYGFARLLLEHGADASLGNGFGKTPLYYAKLQGHDYLASYLNTASSSEEGNRYYTSQTRSA